MLKSQNILKYIFKRNCYKLYNGNKVYILNYSLNNFCSNINNKNNNSNSNGSSNTSLSDLKDVQTKVKFSIDPIDSNTIKGTKLGDTARYIISFECKKCHCRNTKTCTKRAYEKGLVVIKCDGCSVMHLIADNIGWFDKDKKVNFEQLMQEQGESVTKISYQNINNNNNTSLKENKEIKESDIVELHNDYTNIKDKNKNTNKYTF